MQLRDQVILNLGPRTLSRLYCETCNQETLHVRGSCNHCTPRPNSTVTAIRVKNRGRASKAESPWRADHDATCKARMAARQREF